MAIPPAPAPIPSWRFVDVLAVAVVKYLTQILGEDACNVDQMLQATWHLARRFSEDSGRCLPLFCAILKIRSLYISIYYLVKNIPEESGLGGGKVLVLKMDSCEQILGGGDGILIHGWHNNKWWWWAAPNDQFMRIGIDDWLNNNG